MIHKIYNNISDDDLIKCWRNHYDQKGDILININGAIKSISIKMGAKNEVHTENIHYFIEFLKENNIPYYIIKNYLEYHYGDGTLSGSGKKRMSVKEYKEKYQNKIDLINKYFANYQFLINCIDRFILKGNNCNFRISGLIYGVPNDFLFLSSEEITALLLENINMYSTGVHISSLFIQPVARDLLFSGKYENERHKIQVKWFNIFDDVMKSEFKKL